MVQLGRSVAATFLSLNRLSGGGKKWDKLIPRYGRGFGPSLSMSWSPRKDSFRLFASAGMNGGADDTTQSLQPPRSYAWPDNKGSKESQTCDSKPNTAGLHIYQIGQNLSRRDKINFLVTTLMDLNDSKEAVYGALDAWVAWEQNFPIAALKNVILYLEKQQQWHKVIQVIKWMLSKGQGNTLGTYRQLIRALDMDHRAEEAHNFWMKKIGTDLHSVPWQLCHLMISVYYRNNMIENLVKLFKRLEAFGREPPDKLIVQKVANAYDLLGLTEEKERVLEKYKHVLSKMNKYDKKSKRISSKKTGQERGSPKSDETAGVVGSDETYEMSE